MCHQSCVSRHWLHVKIANSLHSPSLPVPSNPQNFVVVDVNSIAITVSWQPPAMPNGVITVYNVWYNQTLNCSGSLVSFSDSVAGSVLMYTFTELEEDTVYVFYVSAETSAGEGEAAMVMGRTSEDGECGYQCVPMIVEFVWSIYMS